MIKWDLDSLTTQQRENVRSNNNNAHQQLYSIEAECPVGCDSLPVQITFTHTKGYPEEGPTYWSGGEPAEDDEISMHSWEPTTITRGSMPSEIAVMIGDWCEQYLDNEGYERACREAREGKRAVND